MATLMRGYKRSEASIAVRSRAQPSTANGSQLGSQGSYRPTGTRERRMPVPEQVIAVELGRVRPRDLCASGATS